MNSQTLQNQIQRAAKQFMRFKVLVFILVLVVVYGFIAWRIQTLRNARPDAAAISSQAHAKPHIDQSTVNKLKQLQDNSVSVRALFNQARQNPFQE